MLSHLQLVLLMHFVVLCYVEAGTTGYFQPLDVAAMRVFNLNFRRFTSRKLALLACWGCTCCASGARS